MLSSATSLLILGNLGEDEAGSPGWRSGFHSIPGIALQSPLGTAGNILGDSQGFPLHSCLAGCEEVSECTGRTGDPAGNLSDPSEEHRCGSNTEEGIAQDTRAKCLGDGGGV